MKELLFVLCAYTFLTTVNGWLQYTTNTDVQFQDVLIHLREGNRTRRSSETSFSPDSYDLDVTVNGSRHHVHLKRNDHIRTNVSTLTLNTGRVKQHDLHEDEESVFYQDLQNGAVFVIQNHKVKGSHMFGVINVNGEEYVLQTTEQSDLKNGFNKFKILKEKHQNITFNDYVKQNIEQSLTRINTKHRFRRAAGSYQVELLIVVDFSVYQYWYDKSTLPTSLERENEALLTVRQFYAFVINGMDGMYKNIQTTAYTISVEFAGIIIAQSASDSSWTESVAVTSTTPYQVDSSNALSNFRIWIQSLTGNLPGHDHAMLFTRYDLTSGGSTGNAGLAYVGAVCTSNSQSIVEDHFNFIMLTVASHELGHSLSAAHDGEGNTCSFSDSYIMASSTSPQQNSATATNPWKFSSCSTNYFTSYIDSLEANSANCMTSLSAGFNSTELSEFENDLPGQVYDADKQCENIRGPGSYFCKDRYSSDFSTICTVMWCSDPANPGYCYTTIAADGTLCGNQKWCVTGVCTYDPQAPTGSSSCLYGDVEGQIFSNQPWNCSDIGTYYYNNCPSVPHKCCHSCAPYLSTTSTTTSTSSPLGSTEAPPSTTSGTGSTEAPISVTTVTTTRGPVSSIDAQCESAKGIGSFMCRSLYSGDYTSICNVLWCSNPTNASQCHSAVAADGTLCGNKKWCMSGVCTADSNAPAGDDTCLYGDRIGPIFTNGWTCADMVANAPSNCPNVPIDCCYSCNPPTTSSATNSPPPATSTELEPETTHIMSSPEISTPTFEFLSSTQGYMVTQVNQVSDIDAQCESALGIGSFMCRTFYAGDYSSICTTLWCSNPSNSSVCHSATVAEETPCGNQKWCKSGICVSDSNAPPGDESCLYGDRVEPVFTNGWTCSDMIANAPQYCYLVLDDCCYSCNSSASSPTLIPTQGYETSTSGQSTQELVTTTTSLPSTQEHMTTTSPPATQGHVTTSLQSTQEYVSTSTASQSTQGHMTTTTSTPSTQGHMTTTSTSSSQGHMTTTLFTSSTQEHITSSSHLPSVQGDMTTSISSTQEHMTTPTVSSTLQGQMTTKIPSTSTQGHLSTTPSSTSTQGHLSTTPSSTSTQGHLSTTPPSTSTQGHLSTTPSSTSTQKQVTMTSSSSSSQVTSTTSPLSTQSQMTTTTQQLATLNFDSGAVSFSTKELLINILAILVVFQIL